MRPANAVAFSLLNGPPNLPTGLLLEPTIKASGLPANCHRLRKFLIKIPNDWLNISKNKLWKLSSIKQTFGRIPQKKSS
jgi:hypothetical protein